MKIFLVTQKMRKELMEAGLMHFEEGALECLNPELTVDDQAELLPYDKKWEFPRERLTLGKRKLYAIALRNSVETPMPRDVIICIIRYDSRIKI